jgi:hypothetical protein
MQQADMVVSLVTGGVAVANGLDTADPEVAPHIGLSAKEKAMLEPLAPAVARRMPAILDATDRYAPYIFGAMLVVACASKGLSLSRIAQRRNVVDSEETPGA